MKYYCPLGPSKPVIVRGELDLSLMEPEDCDSMADGKGCYFKSGCPSYQGKDTGAMMGLLIATYEKELKEMIDKLP